MHPEVPTVTYNKKLLIVPLRNSLPIIVPLESISYYSDTTILFTEQETGKNRTIKFDPKLENGRIAKYLIDQYRTHEVIKSEPPKTEATESKLDERTTETFGLISEVLFEKDKSILIELLSKDAHFLKIWSSLQLHNLRKNGVCCVFDEEKKELIVLDKINVGPNPVEKEAKLNKPTMSRPVTKRA